MKNKYTLVNAKAIDDWVENGWEWGVPISKQEYQDALNGEWKMLLTPQKPVPKKWYEPILKDNSFKGAKVLGLASGGAQQMPIFCGLGADATVLDYSTKQLDSEREVSKREGYNIEIVKADMTEKLPFEDNTFDMIFHPVANCYIENVRHVWDECYRILKTGGVLLAGMDNGINFLYREIDGKLVFTDKLPYNPLKNPELMEGEDSIQFSHTLEEQIGGQLKAGFRLTDVYEDKDGSRAGEYIPLYWASRAVKE